MKDILEFVDRYREVIVIVTAMYLASLFAKHWIIERALKFLVVKDQVSDQVSDQVRDQAWTQVRDQVENQVRDQVENQV